MAKKMELNPEKWQKNDKNDPENPEFDKKKFARNPEIGPCYFV